MNDDGRKTLLLLKNIIKDENGEYILQNNYYEDGDKIGIVVKYEDRDCHYCEYCSRFNLVDKDKEYGYCDIFDKLNNVGTDRHIGTHFVVNCAAYDEIKSLNIVNSIDDMIVFIERTEKMFGCVEAFESYYGMERCWNEMTGEVLETVREYVNRGGKFDNIPTKYPAVIRFDLNCREDLEWIYIGGNDEKEIKKEER